MGMTIDVQDPKAFAEWCKFIGAIPKADYENRLKADMVAMLTEIQLEIEDLDPNYECNTYYAAIRDCSNLTQQKIDKLKEG